ncbi:MAG: hypothetical protein IID46_02675 [Planctomycetes bacterium]|nr:hypothetical protein [Planctomycetota bacterium]
MLKSWKVRAAILCSFALIVVLMNLGENRVQARTQYLKQFIASNKNLEKQAKKTKCNVCHYGKKRKDRNDYGKALAKEFAKNKKKKNEKDVEKIKEVFKKAAKKKSSVKGKTFGDLIKDGKLPGTAPKKDEKKKE